LPARPIIANPAVILVKRPRDNIGGMVPSPEDIYIYIYQKERIDTGYL